jgi:hypothetical protein
MHPPMTVTVNPTNENHILSDDQLTAFNDLAEDHSREWFLFFLASAMGTLQNVWSLFADVIANSTPSLLDVLMSIVFSACVMGSFLKYKEMNRNHPRLKAKIDEIRKRPKVVIANGQIQQAQKVDAGAAI